jgi:hypothetical protein
MRARSARSLIAFTVAACHGAVVNAVSDRVKQQIGIHSSDVIVQIYATEFSLQ